MKSPDRRDRYHPELDRDGERSYQEERAYREGRGYADHREHGEMLAPWGAAAGGMVPSADRPFDEREPYQDRWHDPAGRGEPAYRDRSGYREQPNYLAGPRGPAGSGRDHERRFFDRASDEVQSWFGDEAAERRREQDHRGKGPKGYRRSDDRILEEVNEALTHDHLVDASDVEVTCAECEVTLTGTVESRHAKRRAEDCADSVSGVRHVQNNLRVSDPAATSGRAVL
ncbi:BON domain-containing protein [Sulfitobacter aestuarii]|uniref:BON domain-containing protein n=1 Tax=Sulfitobacter aestuarii TaxID=2161676 RepID=A0ABW5U6C0_9RHOB